MDISNTRTSSRVGREVDIEHIRIQFANMSPQEGHVKNHRTLLTPDMFDENAQFHDGLNGSFSMPGSGRIQEIGSEKPVDDCASEADFQRDFTESGNDSLECAPGYVGKLKMDFSSLGNSLAASAIKMDTETKAKDSEDSDMWMYAKEYLDLGVRPLADTFGMDPGKIVIDLNGGKDSGFFNGPASVAQLVFAPLVNPQIRESSFNERDEICDKGEAKVSDSPVVKKDDSDSRDSGYVSGPDMNNNYTTCNDNYIVDHGSKRKIQLMSKERVVAEKKRRVGQHGEEADEQMSEVQDDATADPDHEKSKDGFDKMGGLTARIITESQVCDCTPPASVGCTLMTGQNRSDDLREHDDDITVKSLISDKPSKRNIWKKHQSDSILSLHRVDHTLLLSTKDDPDHGDDPVPLVGDFSCPLALPTLRHRKHLDLPSINAETLLRLLHGGFAEVAALIVDCRYPYEFEGGHIVGAENIYTREQIMEKFMSDRNPLNGVEIRDELDKREVLIFHCEFSSERAPRLVRFLREQDRRLNKLSYPALYYPEVYVLEGGYNAFWKYCNNIKQLRFCEPQGYTVMKDRGHCQDYILFRKKSRSWKSENVKKCERRNIKRVKSKLF